MTDLLRRHAQERVKHLMGVFPVVAITGARQVGKSTLAAMMVEDLGGEYRTLDDVPTRTRALGDLQGFVAHGDGLLVIDEVQLVPELLRAIKLMVDRDRKPGCFIITGSANMLRMSSVTESLAGRSAWFELAPLMWSEIAGAPPPTAVDVAFECNTPEDFLAELREPTRPFAEEARTRAIKGGMPAALSLDAGDRHDWYDFYWQTFIERDLKRLSDVEGLPEFNRLLSLALLRTGNLLNKSNLASDAQLSHATARRYLNLMELAYQMHELPPFWVNIGKRLVKTPKLYATDCGFAAHVADVTSWRDAVTRGMDGALLETMVVNELLAADRLSPPRSTFTFYRTSGGAEVDLVIERGETVVGVEVKASETVTYNDTGGLRALRDDLGSRFKLGIVAYLGEKLQPMDRDICLVPIASLLGAVRA